MIFEELCKEFYKDNDKIRFSGTYANKPQVFYNNIKGEVLGYIHNGSECIGILKLKRGIKLFYLVNLQKPNIICGYGNKCLSININTFQNMYNNIKKYGQGTLTDYQVNELVVLHNI